LPWLPSSTPAEQREQGLRLAETRSRLQEAMRDGTEAESDIRAYEEARREIVHSHLRLVGLLVRPYAKRGMPFADLLQEGTLGLMKAADLFEPDRGVSVDTRGAPFANVFGVSSTSYGPTLLGTNSGGVAAPVSTQLYNGISILDLPGGAGSWGTMAGLDAPRDGYTWTAGAAKQLGTYPVLGMINSKVDDFHLFLAVTNVSIVSVNRIEPAVPHLLVEGTAGELAPEAIEVVEPHRGARHPDENRRLVGQ
jgi:hypothetical protein